MHTRALIANRALSKNDSNIIKGIGILMIMFHNLFHLISPVTGENEFDFAIDNFYSFINLIATDPWNVLRYISSYLGHYGVQLFIFISAYGLYKSNKDRDIRWLPFMKKRIGKLYPTLALGVVFVFMIIMFYTRNLPTTYHFKIALLKFTLLYNFIPNQALTFSGPWWFFSVIVQLYVVFPALLVLTKKRGSQSMLVIALLFAIISMLFDLYIEIPGFSIFYTLVGQLPVFSLGIYFASREKFKISTTVFVAALIVFALGNINQYAWYFSFMSITILLLVGIIILIPLLTRFKRLNTFIIFSGTISLFLFVVNGPLRGSFVVLADKYNNHPLINLGLSLVFLVVCYVAAIIMRFLEKQIQEFITSGYKIRSVLHKIKTNKY